MSILDYFSKDPNKRAKFIFDFIAPIYGLVDGYLVKSYLKSIKILKYEIDLEGKTILDIGTGTGAWASMFLLDENSDKNNNKIHGVDISMKMLDKARKKYPEINFNFGDAEDLKEIKDNSFDIVTASYVVHGVKAENRAKIISEMKRISKKDIVIHDFLGKTPLFIRVLEFLEKSDYKSFKKNICEELNIIFSDVKSISSDYGTGLYFAVK